MFATLAGRALIPVGLAVTGFTVVCCLVLYSAISENLHQAEIVHATNLADTTLKSTRYAMLKSDRETLSTIIENIGKQKGIAHLRIFNKKGVVAFSTNKDELNHQVDKNTEGCIPCHKKSTPSSKMEKMQLARTYRNAEGMAVMAITAPIYNAPDCSTAACHVHAAGQNILGTLDIGLSRTEIERSLTLLRVQMILFTLMSLVLTIGGVSALLMKNVFVPIKRLHDYVANTESGSTPLEPPPHLTQDLDVIGTSYYNAKITILNSTCHREETAIRQMRPN